MKLEQMFYEQNGETIRPMQAKNQIKIAGELLRYKNNNTSIKENEINSHIRAMKIIIRNAK